MADKHVLPPPSSRLFQLSFHPIATTDSSVDRLPTVSASQALQSLNVRGARTVSTGLTRLDKLLVPSSLPGHEVAGGYARGKVTEVYGPSGVGKTSLLLQAATRALHEGQHVYWIGTERHLQSFVSSANQHQMLHARLSFPTASTTCCRHLATRLEHLQMRCEAYSITSLPPRLRMSWRCSCTRHPPFLTRVRVSS